MTCKRCGQKYKSSKEKWKDDLKDVSISTRRTINSIIDLLDALEKGGPQMCETCHNFVFSE